MEATKTGIIHFHFHERKSAIPFGNPQMYTFFRELCPKSYVFPKVVSYNRFVELEKEVAVPLALFIKKVLLGKCTGISFVDSTPLRVCKKLKDTYS